MALIVIRPEDLDPRASWLCWEPKKELLSKLQASEPCALKIEQSHSPSALPLAHRRGSESRCHPVQISVEELELAELDVAEGVRVRFFTLSLTMHKADCRGPVDAGKIKGVGGPLRFAGGGIIQKIVGECMVYGPDADSPFELILREEPSPEVSIASGTRVRVVAAQRPLSEIGTPRANGDSETEIRRPREEFRRRFPN
jgi:hypothetical protein